MLLLSPYVKMPCEVFYLFYRPKSAEAFSEGGTLKLKMIEGLYIIQAI